MNEGLDTSLLLQIDISLCAAEVRCQLTWAQRVFMKVYVAE